MRNSIIYLALFLAAGLNTAVFAQDEEVKTEKQKGPDLEMAIEMTKTIMVKMFEKAGLSEEQNEKIMKIVDENVKALVYSRQEFQEVLTADQRKKLNNAKKQARKANYSDEDAEAFGLRKLNLSEETVKKYHAMKAKVSKINEKINKSISAVLTDEQKEKLPLFKTAEAKKKDGSASKDKTETADKK